MSAPAGWYPDSTGTQRWWDGTQWTAATAAPANFAVPGQPAHVAGGTSTNTVWVWVIVLLPLVSIIPTFVYLAYVQQAMMDLLHVIPLDGSDIDPQVMIGMQMGLIFNPWYLVLLLVGFATYGVSAWFAYLDARELERRGFTRPFHWAWTFLSVLVYVIGRTVVLRRHGGRGAAPLIVLIATQVVLCIAIFVWVGVTMTQFMDAVYWMIATSA